MIKRFKKKRKNKGINGINGINGKRRIRTKKFLCVFGGKDRHNSQNFFFNAHTCIPKKKNK